MATLADLRASIFPAAIDASAAAAPPPEEIAVGWVRVMRSRVPAFDALDAADLVVAPGEALTVAAPDAAATVALADALSEARVAGVLVVGLPAAPGGLAESLGARAVRLYVLATGEPGSVERSAIGFLVNRRAELDRIAGDLERRLESLALAGRGSDALVGEVAAALGRGVALEDRRGTPAAVHAPPGADTAAAARFLGAAGRSPAIRVPLPGAEGARTGGSLALLGDAPVTELERVVADRIAPVLALALARDDAERTARDAARRSDALPGAGPPWVVVVARQADLERTAREAIRRDVRLLAPARRLALRGDADSLELRAVLAGDPPDPVADDLTRRVAAAVGRPVARSRPFERRADRAVAEAEARTTLEAWELLAAGISGAGVRGGPSVARAERLPAYRLLVAVHNLPDGRRAAEALLAPLRGGSPRAVAERLATLRVVLREGAGAEAAATLGVHRNTLAYRVRRIEALSGWRLSDPELRLPLLIALELVQIEQSPGATSR
ncbi:MAG TPA: helix-turn-helix domain-containing protein [Candidatus Limnocylindrales bacterium]|nr:helix-turn-helix domain-containing protein [Candidatus Limnocylindrales bacterium]